MTLLCYRMPINPSKANKTLKIFSRLLSVILYYAVKSFLLLYTECGSQNSEHI